MKHLVFLFVLLLSSAVHAQDSGIVTIPPGDDLIIRMDKGEEAPYDGQLFSTDTALRWGFWLQQYRLRLKLDVGTAEKKCKVHLEFKDKELQIEKSRYAAVEEDLEARLVRSEQHSLEWQDEAMNPSFFRTFEFGLLVGVVITGAVSAAIAWAVNQKGG